MLAVGGLFNSCVFHRFVLTAAVLLAYFPTFTGEFILDDKPLIEKNPYIKEFHSLKSYLAQEDGVSEDSPKGYHTGYYRPILNLSYWLDIQVWGLNAPGFRTTNLILHLLTCFLLMGLIHLLVPHRPSAFFAALLFAVHPVNTEAVSWVTSRNNILAALFGLWSLYFYIRGWGAGDYRLLLLSLIGFVGSIFSKEFGIMLMPIFFLFHRTIASRKDPGKEIWYYIPFILIIVLYVIFRINATGSMITPLEGRDIWHHLLFAPYLILWNLRLVLLPYYLHSFIIGYPGSYLSWQALAGYGCTLSLTFVVWRLRHEKAFVFGLLGFLMALFPVLNLVPMKSVTLISMRWLYFPMTFLMVAGAAYLKTLLSVNRVIVVCSAAAITLYLGCYSYVLNARLWHNQDTFLEQEAAVFNNGYYARGYALKLLHKRRYNEAERYFLKAVSYDPGKAQTHLDYVGLLVERAQHEEALAYLNKTRETITSRQEMGRWHTNAGMAYFGLGRYPDAVENFKIAMECGRNTPELWANLGATYGAMGEYTDSVRVLEKGLDKFPDFAALQKNLAITFFLMGDSKKAFEVLGGLPAHEVERDEILQKLIRRPSEKSVYQE